MEQLDLVIASQFAELEQEQNKLREGTEQVLHPVNQTAVEQEDAHSVKSTEIKPENIEDFEDIPKEKPEPSWEHNDVFMAERVKQEPVEDGIDAAISGAVKQEEYDSSELELSSDSEDSSEEEDKDSQEKNVNIEEDEEEEGANNGGFVKTANEIVDFTIEKPIFDLTQQTEILFAGSILQVIDNVVVVQSRPGSEYNALDTGSLLVYENREVMGEVFETFGPIARPFYTVRFNDISEINKEWTTVGTAIYYVPSYQKTQIIQTERLRMIKHTDASNFYDEEINDDEMEFSDDEKELAYKQQKNREKRMKKKAKKNEPAENPLNKKMKTAPVDFDAALDAYQSSAPMPPRQQQSYADFF